MFLTMMHRSLLSRLRDWLCDRAGERALLELDDRQLRDVGLTREQIIAATEGVRPLPSGAAPPPVDRRAHRMCILILATAASLSVMFAQMHGATGAEFNTLPSVADLPPGTVKVSPPVPGMGEHWANPRDLPLGPIYCVMDGKVICAEFMIQQLAFIDGKSFERLRLGMEDKLPAVNHLDVTFMPHGHEGFEVPHYDMHMYFVPPEVRFPKQVNR
jgi:uncharacterized protein YjiS (DUF1127 family)